MVSSSERRKLIDAYRESVYTQAQLAKAAAGLLVIVGIAAVGASYSEEDAAQAATVSAKRLVTGR